MPITKITIQNFKGIDDEVEIPLKPITLLFGANSAGKSTILQSLLYLRELLERSNSDADVLMASGNAIDLGGFRQMVHDRDPKREITIGVTLSIDDDGLPVYPVSVPWPEPDDYEADILDLGLTGINEVTVSVTTAWDRRLEKSWVRSYAVAVNGEELATISAEAGIEAYVETLHHDHPIFAEQYSHDTLDPDQLNPMSETLFSAINCIRTVDVPDGPAPRTIQMNQQGTVMPDWRRPIKLPEGAETGDLFEHRFAEFLLSHLLVGAGEMVLNELREIRYLGPIRVIPDRNFTPQKSPGPERWATGLAAWDWVYGHGITQKHFDLNLIKELDLGCHFETKRVLHIEAGGMAEELLSRSGDSGVMMDGDDLRMVEEEYNRSECQTELEMISGAKHLTVSPSDVGVGISQVLPVVIGTMVPGQSILMVEQPELHIHPRIQCNLADVLAKQALKHRESRQLLETHSEHLMLRLMRRIKETTRKTLPEGKPSLTPEDVAVLYVEQQGGKTSIVELRIDQQGQFKDEWPRGFFEERFDELF